MSCRTRFSLATTLALIVGLVLTLPFNSLAVLSAHSTRGAATSNNHAAKAPVTSEAAAKARANAYYGKLPLHFEAHHGQLGQPANFVARGRGYTLSLTGNEAVLSLRSADSRAVVRMQPVNANPKPAITGVDQLPGVSNYFLGNNPKQWRTNVPHFAKVKYEAVYPGIDLVYYGNQRQLEYDLIVAPGADPGKIKLAFTGADKLANNGDPVMPTSLAKQLPRTFPPIAQGCFKPPMKVP